MVGSAPARLPDLLEAGPWTHARAPVDLGVVEIPPDHVELSSEPP